MNNKDIHIGDKVQTLKGTGIVTCVDNAIVAVDLDGDHGSYLFHKEHVWIIEVNNDMSDFRGKRAEMGMYDDAAPIDIITKLKEFIEYLKKHSFLCDPGNWYSFDAIDVDDLDDFLKDFLEENI